MSDNRLTKYTVDQQSTVTDKYVTIKKRGKKDVSEWPGLPRRSCDPTATGNVGRSKPSRRSRRVCLRFDRRRTTTYGDNVGGARSRGARKKNKKSLPRVPLATDCVQAIWLYAPESGMWWWWWWSRSGDQTRPEQRRPRCSSAVAYFFFLLRLSNGKIQEPFWNQFFEFFPRTSAVFFTAARWPWTVDRDEPLVPAGPAQAVRYQLATRRREPFFSSTSPRPRVGGCSGDATRTLHTGLGDGVLNRYRAVIRSLLQRDRLPGATLT